MGRNVSSSIDVAIDLLKAYREFSSHLFLIKKNYQGCVDYYSNYISGANPSTKKYVQQKIYNNC